MTKKCLFVLEERDHDDLRALAAKQGKSMSKLVGEAIGLLKIRYEALPDVYTQKRSVYSAPGVSESAIESTNIELDSRNNGAKPEEAREGVQNG